MASSRGPKAAHRPQGAGDPAAVPVAVGAAWALPSWAAGRGAGRRGGITVAHAPEAGTAGAKGVLC